MTHLYWVALKSIWAKEINRFMRIWVQTLVPPVITMTLYFIIFGNLIGSRIGEMHGFTYMQFIVPGLIMMAVITNAYANVASSFFSAKFQRNIEELLVAPVPTHVIIAGYVGGGVARGLCVGILVTAISLFFVPFQVHSWLFVALTLLLTAILFSLAGLLNAVFAKTFDDISLIPTFVLTPLTYLGGVFYSLTLLPPFWQGLSHLNPIVYMISGFRFGFLGINDVPLVTTFAVLVVFIVAFYLLCWSLIQRGRGLRQHVVGDGRRSARLNSCQRAVGLHREHRYGNGGIRSAALAADLGGHSVCTGGVRWHLGAGLGAARRAAARVACVGKSSVERLVHARDALLVVDDADGGEHHGQHHGNGGHVERDELDAQLLQHGRPALSEASSGAASATNR